MEEGRLTLTIEEAAKLLGIGRQLAYDKVKTGEIPVLKIGRRLLVPRAALEKLLNEPKPLNLTPSK
jgi:excisionase family DNA binding protein